MLGQKAAEVRRMTEGIASVGWAFSRDEIVVFGPGVAVPRVLADRSEVFTGTVPLQHTVFCATSFERGSSPRPEPVAAAPLDTAAVLRRFAWSPSQLALATSCGFPRPALRRERKTADGLASDPLWTEADLNHWVDGIKGLKLGDRR